MTNKNNDFGDLVRSLRESLDVTQKEAGEAIGCSPAVFSDIELGKKAPGRLKGPLLSFFNERSGRNKDTATVTVEGIEGLEEFFSMASKWRDKESAVYTLDMELRNIIKHECREFHGAKFSGHEELAEAIRTYIHQEIGLED